MLPAAVFIMKIAALTMRVKEKTGVQLSPKFPGSKKHIYAFYHSQLLPHIICYRNCRIVSIASDHKDGEIAARAAEAFGIKMARGSSTRGGAKGLLAMKSAVDAGYNAAITVDGPRGPAGSVGPGVVYLAKLTGLSIVPCAFISTGGIRLKTWDKMVIPVPFMKGAFVFGREFYAVPEADETELNRVREEIRLELLNLNKEEAES